MLRRISGSSSWRTSQQVHTRRRLSSQIHGTTILSVRRNGKVVLVGDGQVSLGNTIVKPNANKVRRVGEKKDILVGFAGGTADAFTLLERLEKQLKEYPDQTKRACVELAKQWRTEKYLRNLEAMLVVVDKDVSLTVTGNGDVIEPHDGLIAIGSGGMFALAAARALASQEDLDAEFIARKGIEIAASIDVFTNGNCTVEVIQC